VSSSDIRGTRPDWQSIWNAPPEIGKIAHYATPPKLGQHVGRCYTLPDGRWLIIKFSNTGGVPESYIVLSEPPR
jgi:hypothetical protein